MNKGNKGFIPVMLTPFKENGVVDYDGLTKLTEFYIAAGAAGLFANCQSSEMFELTEEERLAVTKHVVEVAGGSVPVVASGTFGGAISTQADFVKRIYDTGVESVIVLSNMLAGKGESDELFNDRVFQLMDHTQRIPLGFYECPDPFKRVLTAVQLGFFVQTGRFIYHKDTCLDINLVREKLSQTKQASGFGLYDAYMVHAVESLKAGSAGLSCIQGNYYPELVVWLCRHYDDADMQEQVIAVQKFFISHMDVMHQVYPIVAKYFLQKRGLEITTFTRRFVGLFDNLTKQTIDQLYADYSDLLNIIGLQKNS
ncbi:4-hydroxy-tetrahydrodipicolinate synthase [bacterium A37T11]|nr:4-hydroxy-tetrahydrodipicolinate synthase [bacterium A37T11]